MSLRVRILLSILAVNVGVTALLVLYLLSDLNQRAERSQQQARAREEDYVRRFERVFDGVLVVERATTEDMVADAIRNLVAHPANDFVQDGVILQSGVASDLAAPAADERADVPANAAYVNLKRKHRAPGFDEAHARAKINEAIRQRRTVRDEDPARRGWIAAPIRLARRSARDADAAGEIWGAGYFKLDLPADPDDEAPTFQPRTIVLGMGAGTLVLLGLTWLLLERSVLRPLAELAAGASRVARRIWEPPVPGAGHDEIGRVVESFNRMMADVRDAERVLTERVADATRRAEERGRGLVIAQRLAATGTLASGIAHEINNPLGGMLNAALKLKVEAEKEPGQPRLRYVQLLVDGLVRVQEIVRRVLQFTPRRVEPAVVPVLELVRKAMAFAEHRSKRSRVTIRVEGDDAPVLVEPGEVQQVFLNLLLNACDALAEKGGNITVRSRVEGGRVAVDFADDGPGMSKEQQERCFDLFFTTKEPGKGTGLGLSVAHHIVEQHGGTVTVRSEPGAGATFTVNLPVAGAAR